MLVRTTLAALAILATTGSAFAQGFDWQGLLSGSQKVVTVYAAVPSGNLGKASNFGMGGEFLGLYPWKYNVDGAIALDLMYFKGDPSGTLMALDWKGLGRYNILGREAPIAPFIEAGVSLGRQFAFSSNLAGFSAVTLGYTVGAGANFGKFGVVAKYQALNTWKWASVGGSIAF
jgi:hypothetical protein